MDLRSKDLNLLVVFSAIWEERNLTRAAEKLYLSQSAVSHALKRLRKDFDDLLFVKQPEGVSPTDFAISLSEQVLPLIQGLEGLYFSPQEFDLKTIQKDLHLASGDYFAMTKLNPFMEYLRKEAPGVRVIIRPVANIYNEMMFEKGEVDLAITAIPLKVKSGFLSQEIFSDELVCCTRKNHPLFKRGVTLDKYLSASHLNVSNFGREFGVPDDLLKRTRKKRKIHGVVSSFYDGGALAAQSDLVVSAPRGICQRLSELYDLKVHNLDFMKAPRPVSIIWHQRTQSDLFHQAIRSILAKI